MITMEKSLRSIDIEQLVYEEYDMHPFQIEYDGNIRKITCQRGVYALKKCKVGERQLRFVTHWFNCLAEQNFTGFHPMTLNKFGDHIVLVQNESFYVTQWIHESMENKYLQNWEIGVVRQLGQLHHASAQCEQELFRAQPTLPIAFIISRWQNRVRKMAMYKQMAEDRHVLSPFDMAFCSQFKYLSDLSQKAMTYLQELDEKIKRRDKERVVLCHGHIYRQHVLQKGEQLCFINFDYATIDSPVRDLALFFRRHINPNMDWSHKTGFSWLTAYENIFPLEEGEKLLLGIFLLFPERVFKEIEAYYRGKRDVDPMKLVKYFERQIELTFDIRSFVRKMIDIG